MEAMHHIELNRRFPLSIVESQSESPSQLVVFGYSFVPESVDEEQESRVLSISPNGSSASVVSKKTSVDNEYCLAGTATSQKQSDYILRITDDNQTFHLLAASAVSGLKRDRKNDFLHVKDSVSKSARTSLKEKKRPIKRKVPPKNAKTAVEEGVCEEKKEIE
jgi:hypothetical protein